MGNTAIIWAFAAALAAPCFARGLAMRDKRACAELVWYAIGAFFLLGGAILWVSLETDMHWQHRVILGVVGAIFGVLAALSIGEYVHDTQAKKPAQPDKPLQPSSAPVPGPSTGIKVHDGASGNKFTVGRMAGFERGVEIEGDNAKGNSFDIGEMQGPGHVQLTDCQRANGQRRDRSSRIV